MDVIKIDGDIVAQVWRNSTIETALIGLDPVDKQSMLATEQPNVAVGMRLVDGVFVQPAPTKEQLHDFASSVRDRKVYDGIAVGAMSIPTDERTQQVLAAAYTMAKLDPTYTIPDWKVDGAYVSLSNEQIIAIATAVREHVQTCFSLNKTVDQRIDAGEITDRYGVTAAFG